jgi:hypothetical protein
MKRKHITLFNIYKCFFFPVIFASWLLFVISQAIAAGVCFACLNKQDAHRFMKDIEWPW